MRKNMIYVITAFICFSCTNKQGDPELKTEQVKEQEIRKFAEGYVEAMNSSDWKTEMRKYLKEGPEGDAFLEGEYAKFRNSFPNSRTTIKHIAVDGNECILWLEETANFVEPFLPEESGYGDNVLNGIEATGQPLKWNEVWYFDVVDGRFGDKWDFLKDNYAVMKGLNQIK